MTMPANNIHLITDVRNNFMQDTSGNASLNSTKYRDGAGKGTGNVALTDFAGVGWRQGRNLLHQPSASSVRPYHAEGGVDNAVYQSNRFAINIKSNLPEWETETFQNSWLSNPVAWYLSSGFKVMRPNVPITFSWTTYYDVYAYGTYQCKHEYTVRGYTSGYKSGGMREYKGWSPMATSVATGVSRNNSFTFTPAADAPYILISTRCFLWDGDSMQRINAKLTNMRVGT